LKGRLCHENFAVLRSIDSILCLGTLTQNVAIEMKGITNKFHEGALLRRSAFILPYIHIHSILNILGKASSVELLGDLRFVLNGCM